MKLRTNKCKFFTSSIYNTLYPHYLSPAGGDISSGSLKNELEGVVGSYSIRSELKDNLDTSMPINHWIPFFLDSPEAYGYHPIYNNLSPLSETEQRTFFDANCTETKVTAAVQRYLGINSFININVNENAFRDLKLKAYPEAGQASSVNLAVDWHISDPSALNVYPQLGILFWYRRVNPDKQFLFKNLRVGTEFYLDVSLTLTDTPTGLIVPAGTVFKKLDNHKIQMMPYKSDGSTTGVDTLLATYSKKIKFAPPSSHDLSGTTLYDNAVIDIRNINSITKYSGSSSEKITDYTQLENFWITNKINNYSLEKNYIKKDSDYFDIHIPEADVFSFWTVEDSDNGNPRIDDFLREYLPEELEEKYRNLYHNFSNIIGIGSTRRRENLKRICSYLATGPMFTEETYVFRGYYKYNAGNGLATRSWVSYLAETLDFDYKAGRTFNKQELKTRLIQISKYMYREIKNASGNKSDAMMQKKFFDTIDHSEKAAGIINYIYNKLIKKNNLYISVYQDESLALEIDKNLYTDYINGPHVKVDLNFIPYVNPTLKSYTSTGKLSSNKTYDQYIKSGPLSFRTKMMGDASSDGLPITYFKDESGGYTLGNALDGYADVSSTVGSEQNTLLIIHPDVKSIGFYKQGAFKINSSNCYVKEISAQSAIDNGKLDTKPIFLDRAELGWSSYDVDKNDTQHSKVVFGFDCGPNAYIKIYGINIQWYRYNSIELCSCPSFTEEVLNYTKKYTGSSAVGRGLGGPQDGTVVSGGPPSLGGGAGSGLTSSAFTPSMNQDIPRGVGFARVGYCSGIIIGRELGAGSRNYNYVYIPGITNKYSPPIKAYGGYENSVVDALGIKMPKHPKPKRFLPILSYRNELYDQDTKCYMRSGVVTDPRFGGNYTQAGILTARKGIFHPYMGWFDIDKINNDSNLTRFKNITYVNSKKIKLRGSGFVFGENSKYYSSRISVNFVPSVSDNDYYQYGTGTNSYSYLMNNYSDDMIVDNCVPHKNCDAVSSSEKARIRDCVTLNSMGVGFVDNSASVADKYQPAVAYTIPENSLLKKKISDNGAIADGDIKIQDISVKINFLNYVNPQDLRITLYTNLSASINTESAFFEDATLQNKVTELENQNTSNKIVLFNGDYIENYEKDFCITFSDNAPRTNVLSNKAHGVNNVGVESWKFDEVRSHDIVRPTIKTDSDDEAKHYLYKHIFYNNDFDPMCNKFAKWRGSQLNGASFKLVIEMFNNYESKNYSTYVTPDFLNEENDGKFKSSVFSNNLCSFEIIIDTNEDIDNINHPITEHIDYKNSFKDYLNYNTSEADLGIKRAGYNYLINFDSNTKFLLPPINSHAPFNSITNHNTCIFNNEGYNTFAFTRVPALSNTLIAAGSAITVYGLALQSINFSGAVRTAAFFAAIGLGAIAVGANMILNAFANKRRERAVDAYDSSFYTEEYSKRDGFGKPEKALIDISKDGAAWYTFDAQIFKFDELSSPIYKPKVLAYRKEPIKNDKTQNASDAVENQKIRILQFNNAYSTFEGRFIKNNDIEFQKYNSSVIDLPKISWDDMKDYRDVEREAYAIDLEDNKPYQINNKFYPIDTDYTTGNIVKVNDPLCFNIIREAIKKSCKLIVVTPPDREFLTGSGFPISRKKLDIYGVFQTVDPATQSYSSYISTQSIDAGALVASDTDNTELDWYDKFTIALQHDTYTAVIAYPWTKTIANPDLSENSHTYLKSFADFGKQNSYLISGHQAAYAEGSWGTGTPFNYEYGKYITIPCDADMEDMSDKTQQLNNDGLAEGLKFVDKGKFRIGNSDINDDIKFISLRKTSHNKGLPAIHGKNQNVYFGLTDKTLSNNGYYISKYVKYKDVDYNKNEFILNGSNRTTELPDTEYSDYKYWINIDGQQKGRFSRTNSVRVLRKIEYSCYEINNDKNLNCVNVCGDTSNLTANPKRARDSDGDGPPVSYAEGAEALKQKTTAILYNQVAPLNDYGDPSMVFTNTDEAIAEHQALYPDVSNWQEITIEKANLRLSCGNTNVDTILRIREYYYIAAGSNSDPGTSLSAGSGTIIQQQTNTATRTEVSNNAISELIDASTLLESSDNIKIRFVHWPRKLKNIDLQFDSYTPNINGGLDYRGRNKFTDGLNIKNLFYSWMCGYTNKERTEAIKTTVPPYYKILNEMIFRAFYGSKDRIEFKEEKLSTHDDFEWIPYEYDASIDCTASAVQYENATSGYVK